MASKKLNELQKLHKRYSARKRKLKEDLRKIEIEYAAKIGSLQKQIQEAEAVLGKLVLGGDDADS